MVDKSGGERKRKKSNKVKNDKGKNKINTIFKNKKTNVPFLQAYKAMQKSILKREYIGICIQ